RLGKSCQNTQASFDDFPLQAAARDWFEGTVLFVNNRRCQRIQRPFTDYGKRQGGKQAQRS
ncbi:hypothetical protein, partial [uncultured Rikenella sp.]|uniref:hypothetical protein n=1 Tax=uncultured Rikenella sp. TaxID=368003 RepID=UPI00260F8165